MAGRRTFFSFHYDDVWRANIVRMAGVVDAQAAAGWTDASLWEESQRKGDAALERLIKQGLDGTTVTVVLIGAETHSRRWVNYEIEESRRRGNGLLGVHIDGLRDRLQRPGSRGRAPDLLIRYGGPVYNWDRGQFGRWVEKAAIQAGKSCLPHGLYDCSLCR